LGNPTTDANLTNLPAAEAEAEAVAGLYNQPVYTGETATESLVRGQAGSQRVLHIAAHAEFNPVAPLQSGLYLAADDANDGLLHVDEVYGLNLEATDLAVLSACQTNVGNVSPGDDIVALNRAFLFAGAPTVVASLWNVNDQATSLLMTRFYSYLNEGWGEAEALRQAQIDLRIEHQEYAHPYFWAAFVLNGDGGEITHPIQVADDVASVAQRYGPWLGAVLLLALVFAVMRRKRRYAE
jgi:CHAT domain-containing protein